MRNGWGSFAAFNATLLGLTAAAEACPACSSESLCCVPGLGLMGGYVGLVLPILSAFLERPFVSRAGMIEHPLALSLQANLLSAVVLAVVSVFAVAVVWEFETAAFAWMAIAVAVSVTVERWWLGRQNGDGAPLRWRWLILGNLLSATVIFLLPLLRSSLAPGTETERYLRQVRPMQLQIALSTLLVCGTVYAVAFWKTGIRRRVDRRRGFDVLLVSTPSPSMQAPIPEDVVLPPTASEAATPRG